MLFVLFFYFHIYFLSSSCALVFNLHARYFFLFKHSSCLFFFFFFYPLSSSLQNTHTSIFFMPPCHRHGKQTIDWAEYPYVHPHSHTYTPSVCLSFFLFFISFIFSFEIILNYQKKSVKAWMLSYLQSGIFKSNIIAYNILKFFLMLLKQILNNHLRKLM